MAGLSRFWPPTQPRWNVQRSRVVCRPVDFAYRLRSFAVNRPAIWTENFEDPVDGTQWQIDMGFVSSNWRCIWGDSVGGNGCQGILSEPAPERGEGCCSVGAELLDKDEARRIRTLGLSLDPAKFQFSAVAAKEGFFADSGSAETVSTRVVEGACIFLNRPGFAGGEGCALHLAAIADDEDPIEWKPSICWQLPLKIEEQPDGTKLLRRWRRSDWNKDSEDAEVAWCCTEDSDSENSGSPTAQQKAPGSSGADAYQGDELVVESMANELRALVGPEVYVELRRRIKHRPVETEQR